jgi:ATP-dependent Zn protease
MKAHFEIHNFIKPIIYTVFLFCTCFLIAYFIGWLTDNPSFRIALWIIAVILDCFLQYMWWLSLTTTVQPLKYILWFMCTLYMFYAIPSAVMYFNNEMVRKETVVANNGYEIEIIKDRIEQIKKELALIANYKESESKTGYGYRSENIKADKDSLVDEQKEKLARLAELTRENTANGSSNPFKGIEWFMGLIVGITVLMFYFGQFLIVWHMVEEGKDETQPKSSNTKSEVKLLNENKQIETPIETVKSEESNINKLSIIPSVKDRRCQYSKCGKILPAHLRSDAKYCDDNCRLAAFRESRQSGAKEIK